MDQWRSRFWIRIPPVNGSGRRLLEEHGVTTRVGDCAEEATLHFQGYFKREETGMPLVIAKYAMSLDGKIASRTGDSRWITGETARARVHELRSHVDAIITAAGTVISDDPQLTARDADGNVLPRQPMRVIADSTGRTPTSARLFSEPGRTLVATASAAACALFQDLGDNVTASAFPAEHGRVDLTALLQHLGRLGVVQVMTEAGEQLLGALFDEGAGGSGGDFHCACGHRGERRPGTGGGRRGRTRARRASVRADGG